MPKNSFVGNKMQKGRCKNPVRDSTSVESNHLTKRYETKTIYVSYLRHERFPVHTMSYQY
ncbi:hypothetical protein [Emticicia sp. W12TSBA100-4]|uniref:hypothetical protein n=1 Tax=Emticicia sp. W12TSBA100-4 TaxID=3160965 RepID=UPI003305C4D3